MVSHNKPLSPIRQLCQMGLIDDIKKLPYAQIIMQDPDQGVKSMVYRNLAISIFNKLIDFTLNDPVVYNRIRQLLSQGKNPMSEKAFDNLANRADKMGIDLLKIIELYNEGYEKDYPIHLTREQRAFGWINKYLTNEDNEFAGVNDSTPSDREIGTSTLADIYRRGTPGQSKTLKTLKKVTKK